MPRNLRGATCCALHSGMGSAYPPRAHQDATKMLKLEVVALQSQVEVPEEAAPTILPAGRPGLPYFLPLEACQREQFFPTAETNKPTAEINKKTPEPAQHGNDDYPARHLQLRRGYSIPASQNAVVMISLSATDQGSTNQNKLNQCLPGNQGSAPVLQIELNPTFRFHFKKATYGLGTYLNGF